MKGLRRLINRKPTHADDEQIDGETAEKNLGSGQTSHRLRQIPALLIFSELRFSKLNQYDRRILDLRPDF